MRPVFAQLAFANSDFAFAGDHLFQGKFYGVNFYDISDPAKVSLLTSLVCPGEQGDVSVHGNLLLMSTVQRSRAGWKYSSSRQPNTLRRTRSMRPARCA